MILSMKKLILPIAASIFLLSCVTEEEAFRIRSDSFVLGYYELASLQIYQGEGRSILIFENTEEEMISAQNRAAEFETLNAAHGDTGYNQEILYFIMPNIYITPDFRAVDISSDADFDDAHPAGASLGDITRFISISPFKHIESGYRDTLDWKKLPAYGEFVGYWSFLAPKGYYDPCGGQNYFPVDRRVSELTRADLSILGRGEHKTIGWERPGVCPLAVVKFLKEPTASKAHNITVRFTDVHGRDYVSNSLEMTF